MYISGPFPVDLSTKRGWGGKSKNVNIVCLKIGKNGIRSSTSAWECQRQENAETLKEGMSRMSAPTAKIRDPFLRNITYKPLRYSHSLISWRFPCTSLGQPSSSQLKLLNSNTHFCISLDSLPDAFSSPLPWWIAVSQGSHLTAFSHYPLLWSFKVWGPFRPSPTGLEPASNHTLSFSGVLDLSKFS